jgi:hypothetical protein
MYHTHPIELITICAQLSLNDLLFTKVRLRGGNSIICIPTVYTVPQVALKRQIQPSNIQRLWIELFSRLYNLSTYNYPRLLPCFLLILLLSVFYIYSARYLIEALIT